ncbi:MAG: hypothetical protein O2782_05590, partial [bacterium]|nr:hypothetical protein [bacterium]
MSDVRTITKTTYLQGDVRVPGELRTATQAFWLAAISAGTSCFTHVPPAAAATLELLQVLGVEVTRDNDTATVAGVGLHGLRQSQDVIDLDIPEPALLPAVAILSQQTFVSRVRIPAPSRDAVAQLLGLLARTGAAYAQQDELLLRLDGTESPVGVTYEESDLPGSVKLGLLTAGLFGDKP